MKLSVDATRAARSKSPFAVKESMELQKINIFNSYEQQNLLYLNYM